VALREKTHHGPSYALLEASWTLDPPHEVVPGGVMNNQRKPSAGNLDRMSDTGLPGDMYSHGLSATSRLRL
jgi:hypothetical protein